MNYLMLDIEGTHLNPDDIRRLHHTQVAGVILFQRNYVSPAQLTDLIASIRAQRPEILIAVDHEGGRVQRFREGFTPIPPMGTLGKIWAHEPQKAMVLAKDIGWVIATELRSHDIDFSFTPVLDLDYGYSQVIGSRAFHSQPDAVITLARQLLSGLAQGGMRGIGKHFPGHGFVAGDTHTAMPIDQRSYGDIMHTDGVPFVQLMPELAAIMPAHIIYPQVCPQPVGFSKHWLQTILRGQLGFQGAIVSDDLSMVAAHAIPDVVQRVQAAWTAGCDMVLLCNQPTQVDTVLAHLTASHADTNPLSTQRLSALRGSISVASSQMVRASPAFLEAQRRIVSFNTVK